MATRMMYQIVSYNNVPALRGSDKCIARRHISLGAASLLGHPQRAQVLALVKKKRTQLAVAIDVCASQGYGSYMSMVEEEGILWSKNLEDVLFLLRSARILLLLWIHMCSRAILVRNRMLCLIFRFSLRMVNLH